MAETDTSKIISIEGYETDEGITIKYLLPQITSDTVAQFYRTFIIELCQRIGQLEGAERLLVNMEEDSVEEV